MEKTSPRTGHLTSGFLRKGHLRPDCPWNVTVPARGPQCMSSRRSKAAAVQAFTDTPGHRPRHHRSHGAWSHANTSRSEGSPPCRSPLIFRYAQCQGATGPKCQAGPQPPQLYGYISGVDMRHAGREQRTVIRINPFPIRLPFLLIEALHVGRD